LEVPVKLRLLRLKARPDGARPREAGLVGCRGWYGRGAREHG
jgi:hypothetical protein